MSRLDIAVRTQPTLRAAVSNDSRAGHRSLGPNPHRGRLAGGAPSSTSVATFLPKIFWRNFEISERFARGTRHTLNRMGVDGTIMPRLTGDDRFQHLHSLVCRAGHREDYCVETRCNEYRFWRQDRPRARNCSRGLLW